MRDPCTTHTELRCPNIYQVSGDPHRLAAGASVNTVSYADIRFCLRRRFELCRGYRNCVRHTAREESRMVSRMPGRT